MHYLKIGTVEFDEAEGQICPSPAVSPPTRRATFIAGLELEDEVVLVTGVQRTRTVRFACAPSHGYCTPNQKIALTNLYLGGEQFSVLTDLLTQENNIQTYANCFFVPGSPPVFTIHDASGGTYWYYDISLRMPETP